DILAARDKVWAAFLDPTILAQALPGCEKLEAIGPNEYKATMKVGVAAIKGTFEGKVKLSDLEPPHRYRMAVEGSVGPGVGRGRRGPATGGGGLRGIRARPAVALHRPRRLSQHRPRLPLSDRPRLPGRLLLRRSREAGVARAAARRRHAAAPGGHLARAH